MSPGSKSSAGTSRYQSIFMHSLHAIFIQHPGGGILESNTAASRMLGYTAEEFRDISFSSLISHPDGVPAEGLGPESAPVPVTAIARNGQRIACWYSSIVFLDENGEERTCRMLADITGSPQHNGYLLREKELSDTIINSLPGIFYLFNAEGRFIRWNKNLETVSGYTGATIAKMHPLDFFGIEEQPLIRERIAEVFSKGRSDVEAPLLTSDGLKIPHYFNGVSIEFENQSCLIGMGIDISLRVDAEQLIRESNERFNIVAMATNDNIWDWDLVSNHVKREGKKLEVLLGYKAWEPEEVDGNWSRFTHPEDREKVLAGRRRLLKDATQNYWEDEYRFLKPDGSYACIYDRGYIIRNAEGRAVRMIGASQDITQRKKHEEELREKNDELKRLSAYLQGIREEERKYMAREVHDELGQLASALKMDVDWLSLKLSPAEESVCLRFEHAKKTVDVLINSVRRMAYSLRPSILDDFGLNEALRWYCNEFRKLNGGECVFEADMDDSVLDTHIKTELFRIGQESLTNVMRHAGATRVSVRTHRENGKLYLTIFDNGKGFDTNQPTGTLGLVGLRERVISMNGELHIRSLPGEGTTITVCIPD